MENRRRFSRRQGQRRPCIHPAVTGLAELLVWLFCMINEGGRFLFVATDCLPPLCQKKITCTILPAMTVGSDCRECSGVFPPWQ